MPSEPLRFLVWTWPLFRAWSYMYVHTHAHTHTCALYAVSGGEAIRPCTGGQRRAGVRPEVEPGQILGAWPAGRQLEKRLDSGGTGWSMDPDLENVRMWWGYGRHSGCAPWPFKGGDTEFLKVAESLACQWFMATRHP